MSAKPDKANSVRLPPNLQKKVEMIAAKNHLAVADVDPALPGASDSCY